MVQYVPAEKVINAVPFYTRIWETASEGVKSQAVGMTAAEDFLAQRGVEAVWDETTCQNTHSWKKTALFSRYGWRTRSLSR